MVVGVNTDVIAAEKMIVTAGAVDSHGQSFGSISQSQFDIFLIAVHFICPQLWTEVSLLIVTAS